MNTEKHSDREVEELAEKILDKHLDGYQNSFGNVLSLSRSQRKMFILALVEMAGFKAAQERQGEEMDVDQVWEMYVEAEGNAIGSYSIARFFKEHQFTIKKKQQ